MQSQLKEKLQSQVDDIRREDRAATARAGHERRALEAEAREPFGRWLLAQRDRGDWIDHLANAARADRGFPKNGTPQEVGKRMQLLGADADAFEQLEDAERMWASA